MKKFLNISVLGVSLFMVLLLVVCMISLLSGFVPYLNESANAGGLQHMSQSQSAVDQDMTEQFDHLAKLTDHLSGVGTSQEVVSYLREFIGSEQFGDLQYVCQGKTYSESGSEISKGPAFGIETGTQKAVSKVEYYPLGQTRCVALYLPVKSSMVVDGLISIIPAEQLLDLDKLRTPPAQIMAVVTSKGDTISLSTDKDFPIPVGPDFLEFFKTFSQSKETSDELQNMLRSPIRMARQLTVGAANYTVATAPLDSAEGGVYLVEISPSEQLVTHQRSYLQQTIMIAVLAMITLVCSAVYLILARKKTRIVEVPAESQGYAPLPEVSGIHVDTQVKPVVDAPNTAVPHSCQTPEIFIAQCGKIAAGTGRQKRVLLCAELHDFAKIQKTLGVDLANNALFHVEKVLSSMCKENEIFCYGGGGCFYATLRCPTQEDLQTRSQLLIDLVRQARMKVKLTMHIGAYQMTAQNVPVKDMMQSAALAKNMVRSNTTSPYVLFTQELVEEHKNNGQIEKQMAEALKTGEFKLFLQPKYNVENDCIDSAEALVRWFDPRKNQYVFPVKFIPLFESNGFITELDHFMYLEVLDYLEAALEKGEKVCPICVNVSRVTALQPDFFSFYVSKKKMHNIPDQLLTLEFNESFMAENIELMKNLIPQLNENGIRISVDNFTSGSDSLGILKKLPVNEINIDRSFLFSGGDSHRDQALQKALVFTAKDFGIRVVQSGVENKEQFDQCCGVGCDLIQGYYFARAISLEEYRIFIRTNTSIRYKAVVK